MAIDRERRQSVADHGFVDYTDCPAWVDGVNADHVQYVVVLNAAGDLSKFARFAEWTTATSGKAIFDDGASVVYRITAPLSARRCPAPV